MAALAVSTRRIVHEPSAPDLPFREEHFGYRFNDLKVPPEQAGIVLVDCWDIHITASHVERTSQICRERIRPVLDACREIGVTVIHAPSPRCGAQISPVAALCRRQRVGATTAIRASLAA